MDWSKNIQFEDSREEAPEEKGSQLASRMLKTRSILLTGEVNKDLAERVIRTLLILEEAGNDPIKVFIDSPGGDVYAGYAIFDMIRFILPEVYTIGMGLVASAAALKEFNKFATMNSHRNSLPTKNS